MPVQNPELNPNNFPVYYCSETRFAILSHIEEGSICYSVQFEVENSAKLHRWHQEQGVKLNEELLNIFKDKVIGFPTLMEVIV